MAEPPTSLGEFIRRQRELSAMSMREAAQMAGISNPYLSQIERGLREPSEQVLRAIADALNVSVDSLPAEEQETDESSAVLDAIEADSQLTARQRQALAEVYRAFVSAPRRSPRRRR